MDDDDFRRGKPSNHKVFGEAHAILAGDGLLSYAFDLLIEECARGARYVAAAKTLAKAAGVCGMVAGQSADLLYSGRPLGEVGEEELRLIHTNKTAKLIAAPLVMAANIAGAWEKEAHDFGISLGLLFQITDDILDEIGDSERVGKTLGKDRAEGKLTCVGLYGLRRAQELADEYAQKCLTILEGVNADTAFFRSLVRQILERNQ
ncbi:MAG: polyprenyl synthetase family protein [Clostridia bacterium]|nr:polyprenyl synthetase family protein [Clostridia bacterium]